MQKEKCTDLHLHTWESFDSSLTFEDVFSGAKQNNTRLISITDHNSVDGLVEFAEK